MTILFVLLTSQLANTEVTITISWKSRIFVRGKRNGCPCLPSDARRNFLCRSRTLTTTDSRIAFIENTFKLHLATHHTFTLLSSLAYLDIRRYASVWFTIASPPSQVQSCCTHLLSSLSNTTWHRGQIITTYWNVKYFLHNNSHMHKIECFLCDDHFKKIFNHNDQMLKLQKT